MSGMRDAVEAAARAIRDVGIARYLRDVEGWRKPNFAPWDSETEELRTAYLEDAQAALTAAKFPDLLTDNRRLRDALQYARNELDRCGYGDFHYGETPRDPRILAALEIADAAIAKLPSDEGAE